MRWIWLFAIAACDVGYQPKPPPSPPAVVPEPTPRVTIRMYDLLAQPQLAGTEIVLDVHEPVAVHNVHDDDGLQVPSEYSAETPDHDVQLRIIAANSDHAHADGALVGLLYDVHPPIRVRGVMSPWKPGDAVAWFTARHVTQLALPKPVPMTLEQLEADPKRWHGQFVVVEGDYAGNFEISRLGPLWLGVYPGARDCSRPPHNPKAEVHLHHWYYPIRATGYVYTRGHYGQMNGFDYEIVATRIECL